MEILLLSLMMCTIVLFFDATYATTLFIDSFFCVSNICSEYFRTSSVWNGKIFLFRILYIWLLFCLQQDSSHCSVFVFVCQKYAVTLLELLCLKREKSLLEDILQLVVVLFKAEFVVFFVVCLSFFWCSFLESPLCTTIFMTVEHVFNSNLTCLTQLFNLFYLFFFIM